MNTNLKLEEVKALQDYKKLLINNVKGVNCYAYALGLDIPEDKLGRNAYGIMGTIARIYGKYPYFETLLSSLDKRITMDFETLNLDYMEVGPEEHLKSEEWKIALFLNGYDEVHFAKQVDGSTWWHKYGYFYEPTNKDDIGNIIYKIDECQFGGIGNLNYRLKKCYSLKRKQ